MSLQDLAEVDPALARGFQQLLDYSNEDIYEIFPYSFVVEYEGESASRASPPILSPFGAYSTTRIWALPSLRRAAAP